jgi:hypothetical protein
MKPSMTIIFISTISVFFSFSVFAQEYNRAFPPPPVMSSAEFSTLQTLHIFLLETL